MKSRVRWKRDRRSIENDISGFNSAALRRVIANLRDLASNFQRYPDETVTVEGHTDSVGSRVQPGTLSAAPTAFATTW